MTTPDLRAHRRRVTLAAVAACLVAAAFIAVLVIMAVRDHRAEARCDDLGGVTYDSGQHCTIGGTTRSTR